MSGRHKHHGVVTKCLEFLDANTSVFAGSKESLGILGKLDSFFGVLFKV